MLGAVSFTGPGNARLCRFTAPLKSAHGRSHFSTTSTFLPASTSTFSTAGVSANGGVSRIATTSSRVGRLEFRSVLFHTREYGRTSRVIVSSPRLAVATSFTGPTQSGASASAHSTTTPRVSLLIVVGETCSPFSSPSAVIVSGPVKPPVV